jgi:predicted acyltransferase
MIFGIKHIYQKTDPEGLVSNLTSFTTMFMGLHFCRIMQEDKKIEKNMLLRWFKVSVFLILLSINLYSWSPYNKKVWTVAFSFVTSGVCGLTLIFCYLVVDKWNN